VRDGRFELVTDGIERTIRPIALRGKDAVKPECGNHSAPQASSDWRKSR
jgi:hypothetical protein